MQVVTFCRETENENKQIFILTRLLGCFAPIFNFHCEHVLFVYIVKKNFVDFKNFQKSNFDGGKFLKIRSINLSWGHVMSHKKFGPDRFSRFDVYWIQTDGQTDRQTDRQAKFIYRFEVIFLGIHQSSARH